MNNGIGLVRNKNTNVINNNDESQYRSFIEKRNAAIAIKTNEEKIEDLTREVQSLREEIALIRGKLNV